MRGLAAYATEHPTASNVLLDVVNWAALWCVVPVLTGRGARRALIAGALGLVTGAVEVVAFYGDVLSGSPVKLVWLTGGAVGAGLLAMVSQRLRARSWSPLLLPALFVVEPALGLLAFRALGRHPWSSWGASALAEVLVGVAAAGAVAGLVVRRPERLERPVRAGR
jgi:hypothetical protein